jgi:hypothetical protein
VRIEADDRLGLERLLRCCARPGFELERLHETDAERNGTTLRETFAESIGEKWAEHLSGL